MTTSFDDRVDYLDGIDRLASHPLGSSGVEVSVLALGSWKTFERVSRDQASEVMRAARDAGINFLDDARYNDETLRAPIPTGHSEVLFGELFRDTWSRRADIVVANKLWWEFWPEQSAAQELDGSLGRMRFDYVDLIYSLPPPDQLGVDGVVDSVGGLIDSGKARMWGVANWPAEMVASAVDRADAAGVPRPCAAQLPYSLVQRDWVEGETMARILHDDGVGLVASYSLAGGTLTGKYSRGESGRESAQSDNPVITAGKHAATALTEVAREWGVTEAALALAFALAHPDVCSVLFGATSAHQLVANLASIDVVESLDDGQFERLRAIGGSPSPSTDQETRQQFVKRD